MLCFLAVLFVLSACGKKEQTGAQSASSSEAQQEETLSENSAYDGQTGEDEDGAVAAGNGSESESAQNGQGAGAEDAQSGQEWETGTVRNGHSGDGNSVTGQDFETESTQNGQGEETEGAQNRQDGGAAQGNTSSVPQPAAAGTTPYGAHGALSVSGTQIVDAYGAPYQLRGVSTHGLSWFPQYANQAAFRTMRDEWGVNVVRLAMYTAENGGYCVGNENNRSSLKRLVYDSVDAATELGMYVIVDWHVLNDRDPNTYVDQAIAFFRETAGRYASYDNVIYEICNEPNGGVSWQSVKSYAEQVIPVIREQDPDAIIIVGTPTWSQDVDQAAANPITGYQNIMYALHFYADTHRDGLRRKMVDAIAAGLPVFVSEYGICDASGSGAINVAEADKWVQAMDENGVSYCIWNLSNKAETSALLRSSTTSVSGWTYDELSDSGKWFVNMMGADHAAIGSTGGNSGNGTASGGGNSGSGTSSNGGGNGAAQNGGNGSSGNGASSGGGSGGNGSGGNGAASGGSNGAAQSVTSDASGSPQASLSLSNTWETNGKYYYQYTLELTNTSGARVNGWTCEISFDRNMSVSQSWCGSFSVSGSSLTVTPEAYNAAIEAGATQGNIGFILEADGALNVTGISCR